MQVTLTQQLCLPPLLPHLPLPSCPLIRPYIILSYFLPSSLGVVLNQLHHHKEAGKEGVKTEAGLAAPAFL